MKGSGRKLILFFLILMVTATALLVGCRNKKKTVIYRKARVIKYAYVNYYVPYDYIDEKGNPEGFEVSVMKAVDELLPEYVLQYNATSDDDLLIGVQSGKYDVGTKGVWLTEERKKKYLFPEEPIATSIIGITYRTSDANKIKDLESFARTSGKLVPIPPQSAQFSIVQDFNKEHPDCSIKLLPSDVFTISDAYTWILEGRYDAFFDIKLAFENNVAKEGAPYHKFADRLSYVPYKAIPTWPLFNIKETDFAAAYDKAIKILRENGTLSTLSEKYFGEDIFAIK